jgi:predicted ABC-type transport system involved in lysophospholipase L1 biosynthesis ATPase subunit
MHMATTPEEQKQWMAQWRSAEVALYEQKFLELQAMTEEEAVRISNMLLQFALGSYRNPARETYSGLIVQQRIFHGKKAIH